MKARFFGGALLLAGALALFTTGCGNEDVDIQVPTTQAPSGAVSHLSAPRALKADTDVGLINLRWDAVEHAEGYEIYGGDTGGALTLLEDIAATSIAFTGLQSGADRSFFVRAYVGNGDERIYSEDSETVSAVVRYGVPAPPQAVKAEAGAEKVTLSWGASEGATGYEVFARLQGTEDYVSVCKTQETSAAATKLTGGKTYEFYVQAYTEERGYPEYGNPSETVSATPEAAVLSRPTGVAAMAQDTAVQLLWDPVPDAAGYRVRMAKGASEQFSVVQEVTGTNVTIPDLSNDVSYRFTVQAFLKQDGKQRFGAECDPVSATPSPQAMTAPTGVTATAGDRQITLSWQAVADAERYQILRLNADTGEYRNVRTVKDATSTVFTGLQNGVSYTYAVKACRNVAGSSRLSEMSAAVSATPVGQTAPPAATTQPPQTAAPTPPAPAPSMPVSDSMSAEILRLVNEQRAANGLAVLTLSSAMQPAADLRVQEIRQTFSHTRPDGTRCFSVLGQFGIQYRACGENIARGMSDAATVMNGWMNSEGHRANILSPNFTQLAVGFDPTTNSWVQLFIG